MYESFYGLIVKPFQIIPSTEFLYLSPKHESALTYLEYGIMERAGFILLTGEIGTGKSTLLRYVLDRIDPEIETAVIFNTNVTPQELLNIILGEFGLTDDSGSKAHALDTFYRFLVERYSRHRRVLLIIDEAQNLSRDALEEVRMLSNLVSDDQMLLHIILAGQPEIRFKLMKPELAQLNQRISVAFHLTALTQEETGEYIAFRLEKAGGRRDLFTDEAIERIYQASEGIPRTINILCDSALVYGYADELEVIDLSVIEQVIQDRGGMGLGGPGLSAPCALTEVVGENVDVLGRMHNMEKSLAELKMQVDWMIGNLKETAEGYKDDLVHKIKELYILERERSEKLIIRYTLLKEKYSEELAKRDAKETGVVEGNGAIWELRRKLQAEQDKNSRLMAEYVKLQEEYSVLLNLPRENEPV